MRRARHIGAGILVLLALTAAFIAGFATLYPPRAAPPRDPAPVIIVLGGGVLLTEGAMRLLDEQSLRRMTTGIALSEGARSPST